VQQILKAAVQKGEKEKYSINIYFVYLREACTVPTLQVKSLSFWSLSMIEVQYSGGDHRQLELSFESMVCSWIQVHPSLQSFVARV
jgi:hypothetical protein